MKKTLLFVCGLALAGCGKSISPSVQNSVDKAGDQIGCSDFSSSIWDVVTTSLIDDNKLPDAEIISKELNHRISDKHKIKTQARDVISQAVLEFASYLQKEFANTKDANQLLETVVALEVGDHSDPVARARQKQISNFINKMNSASLSTQASCASTEPPPVASPPNVPPTRSVLSPMAFGARKALATAYQSCASLEKPPLDAHTSPMRGIAFDGMHPDGIGRRRIIGDLREVQNTHPYLESAYAANCLRVRDNPLIYDYGGKPYSTSADTSNLDFFKNMGSGTAALGMDCSGYVFSALATAGLKIDPNKKMKASYVYGIRAMMYMEPEQNGLPCFEKLSVGVSGDLQQGDVIAGTGHVQIVDSVGADPLGTKKPKTSAECDAITSNDFDFVIAQSSPSAGGVGINRYQARDYLAVESQTFKPGLEDYARQACKARLQNKNVLLHRSDLSLVRHKLTPQCKSTAIALAGESCIVSCPELQ